LFEVTVRCQRVQNTVLGHEPKTDGITQGPFLVRPLLQLRQDGTVQRLTDEDHLNGGVVLEIGYQRKSGLPGKAPGLSKGDEFRQDITVGQPERGGPEKPHCLGVLRFRAMVKTKESRCVQLHPMPS